MPLKAAMLMLAEMLRAPLQVYPFGFKGDKWFSLSQDKSDLLLVDENGSSSHYHVPEKSLPAWKIFLDTKHVSVTQFTGPQLRWFAEDLRLHLADASHELVSSHPEIGEKYLEIRSDIFKEIQASTARRSDSVAPIIKKPR